MKRVSGFVAIGLLVLIIGGCFQLDQKMVNSEELSFILNEDGSVSIKALKELTGIDMIIAASIEDEAITVDDSLLKIVTHSDEYTTRIAIVSTSTNIIEGEEIAKINGNFTTLKNLVVSSSAKYLEMPSPKPQAKPPFPDGISIVDGSIDKASEGYFLVHAENVNGFAGVEITITYDPQYIIIDKSKGEQGVNLLNSFGTGLLIVQHTENSIKITTAFNSAKSIDSEYIYQIHFIASLTEGKTIVSLSGELRDANTELIQTTFHDGEIVIGGPKLIGDFDNSNKVDLSDFILFARSYGSVLGGEGEYSDTYDIAPAEDKYLGVWAGIYDSCTPDGKIDLVDFIIFARNYGKKKPNEPPFISVPDQQVAQGETLELDLLNYSSDPEGDSLLFTLEIGSPGTITNSIYSYTPDFDTLGNQIVEITVEDTAGNAMTDDFIIEITKTNRPPVTDGIADQTIAEGETLNIQLFDYFEDPDGDNLVFAVVSGVGTVVGSEYTYSPDYDAAGTYQVRIKAADGNGGEVETTFTLTVENTNRPPEEPQLFTPDNTALLISTTSVELSWDCNDPDGQLLTYDVYFGENTEALEVIATQSATSFLLEGITAGKTYYWMIVARDPFGDETPSVIYSFSTDYYLIPGGEFEGVISGYALMTKANSPYIITGDIIVESGAQLIIEPGVEVRFTYISDPDNNGQEDTNAADLIVYGKLFAEGSATEPILFTSNEDPALKGDWGGIRFSSDEGTSTIYHATIEMAKNGVWTSETSNIEIFSSQIINNINSGVYVNYKSTVRILKSLLSDNSSGVVNNGIAEIALSKIENNYNAGIYSYNDTSIEKCTIANNNYCGISGYLYNIVESQFSANKNYAVEGSDYTIQECLFKDSSLGIKGSNITVIDSTFEGQFLQDTSIGIYIHGQALISHNVISGYSTGITVSTSMEVKISEDLIMGNFIGIYFGEVSGQKLNCSNNNIYGNRDWNVYNDSNQRVAITDSFWGTNDESVIKSNIFDYFEDSSRGPVSYTGFKSSLVEGATSARTIATILYGRKTPILGDEVTVEWTAYDPDGVIQSFNLYFGDTEPPGIHIENVISPVTFPVDHAKTYYSSVKGFNSKGFLEAESTILEIRIGLPVIYGGSSYDYGYSVVETSDGGLVVTGSTDSFGNGTQVYLLKTDSTGNLLWEKNFGGTSDDYGRSVVETSDGGLVVTGGTSSFGNGYQVYLLKTDSDGNLLWENNFGGSNSDYGYSVVEASDGGLVVTGGTSSFGNGYQVYLLKTNSGGNLLWEKSFGGSIEDFGQRYDSGNSVIETADGGLVVTGNSEFIDNNDPDNDHMELYLLKTDSIGNLLWEKNFVGTGSTYTYGHSAIETTDGGLVVAGATHSFGDDERVYLLKTDSNGNLLWEKGHGSSSGNSGKSVIETTDGGLVVTGITTLGNYYQVYLLKTDSNGNLLWENNFGGSSYDIGYSVVETNNDYLVVVGYTTSFGNGSQVYMVWTDSEGHGVR